MISRADRSLFARWWWTVDRWLLATILLLMAGGVVLSLAASPAVAERLNIPDSFHFVKRQVYFLIPAVIILLGTSLMEPRLVRRVALFGFCFGILLLVATLFFGAEVKGAKRWLYVGPLSIQPSEFVKPLFVILAAWAFSENTRRPDMPGVAVAVGLLVLTAGLLVLQPDFGQTMLITLVWGALFFMAGMSVFWIIGLGGIGAVGIATAYMVMPHVAGRINRFLDKSSGDTYQVDTALEAITRGGFLGRGPGEGVVKRVLPDSHTDFIFAVAAEEFGIIICLVLVCAFAFIVLRGLFVSQRTDDPFIRLATAGLVIQFGLQSVINMAVNLHLMPAKGMTLPFISYGGSSLWSLAFGMGLVLSLTRRRPLTAARLDEAVAA